MKHYGDLPLKILSKLGKCALASMAYLQEPQEIEVILNASKLFDSEYYLLTNKDVKASGVGPLMHYVRHGWKEGRNPNLWFDSSFYAEDNPDISEKLTNPLLHFICAGFQEGRRPNRECPKTGRRLVLVILAGDNDLNYTMALLKMLSKAELPDEIIVFTNPLRLLRRPEAFMELCAFGARIRTIDNGYPGSAVFSALVDFQGDAIAFINPTTRPTAGWLAVMRNDLRKEPTHLQANRIQISRLGDDIKLVDYAENNISDKHICIPIVDCGILIPPNFSKHIITDIQLLQKHAPRHPDLWFAIEAIINSHKILPSANSSRQTAKLNISLETLKEILCVFRRQLDPLLATRVAEHAYGKKNKNLYETKMKRKIDLSNPVTFNEKLQILKFHEDTDLKTLAADKYKSREYIRSVAGSKYLIPLYGVWKHFDDIEFAELPASFVLKTNHSNSQNMIVLDKQDLDVEKARNIFAQWLNVNFAPVACEMNYFDIEPLIICEEFLGRDLPDYRVMCFNGKPEYICVDTRTSMKIYRNIFTPDWRLADVDYHYPRLRSAIKKPKHLNLMLDLAFKICKPFAHARSDFYIHPDGRLLIGETTFYSCAGFIKFEPESFDIRLGNLIKLPPYHQYGNTLMKVAKSIV